MNNFLPNTRPPHAQLLDKLMEISKEACTRYPRAAKRTVGRCNEENKTILDLFELNFFSCVFHTLAIQEIVRIKDDHSLDRSEFYFAIIHKYIGISENDFRMNQLAAFSATPNAYHATPLLDLPDSLLHRYFQQPFQLFGISSERRRNTDISTTEMQWTWCCTPEKTLDSAPLFRKILQAYLLAQMEEDIEEQNHFGLPLLPYFRQVKTLQELCISEIKRDLFALLKTLEEYLPCRGLLGEQVRNNFDNLFPGFTLTMSHYALGRLLFGQLYVSLPHAKSRKRLETSSKKSFFSYLDSWFGYHFHLSISLYWGKLILSEVQKGYVLLSKYLRHESGWFFFLSNAFFSIPFLTFLLLLSPILLLTPCVYGLTSLPFNLIRTLWLHGPRPFPLLRRHKTSTYLFLSFLDILEALKDLFIFGICCTLLVQAFASLSILTLPLVATPAFGRHIFWIVFPLIPSLSLRTHFILQFALHVPFFFFNLTETLFQRTLPYFFERAVRFVHLSLRYFITALFINFQLAKVGQSVALYYMLLGLSARFFSPFLRFLSLPFQGIFSPFSKMVNNTYQTIRYYLKGFFEKESVPTEPLILLPQRIVSERLEPLLRKLAALLVAPHLSLERKAHFKRAKTALETVTHETEKQAFADADAVTAPCFTKEQALRFQTIIREDLKPETNDEERTLKRELQGIGMAMATANFTAHYQPSWACLHMLAKANYLNEQNSRLDNAIKEKCRLLLQWQENPSHRERPNAT